MLVHGESILDAQLRRCTKGVCELTAKGCKQGKSWGQRVGNRSCESALQHVSLNGVYEVSSSSRGCHSYMTARKLWTSTGDVLQYAQACRAMRATFG